MKNNFKKLGLLFFASVFGFNIQAQNVSEGTAQWFGNDHSAWKIEPQAMQNYVIMGNKFFEPNNNTLYMSQFSEFAQFNSWHRAHATNETLQTFWKSFCKGNFPVGYFAVASISNNRAFAIATNSTGHKLWDNISVLPFAVQYGGVCQASNGGYVACGSSNSGDLAVTKFDSKGKALWTNEYPVSGFGWAIKQAVGGGYVIAGTRTVTRIDADGTLDWSININLPNSPDGSAYTYTEFEEILPLTGEQGFIVTGSCFSNSHSGVYTARITWSGAQAWGKINDAVNTSLAGTPVCWVNNAIFSNNGNRVITTWRRGPVSAGGGLNAQLLNITDGSQGPIQGLNNTIPVQEAFATRAHGKLVIGGTRGTYSQVYAYSNATFLIDNAFASGGFQLDEENIPNLPTVSGFLTSVRNAHPTYENGKPIFDNPIQAFTSRTAYTDLTIFPNPSNGLVYVGGVTEPGASLRVFDLNGRLLALKNIQEGDAMIQFDLSGQPKGVYSVQMVGARYNVTRKFIIE